MNYTARDRRQAELAKEVEQLTHDLEQERAAHAETERQRQAEGKFASGMASKPEVKELLEYMESHPVLYHELMLHFQKFRAANKESPEPGQP